MYSTPSSFKNQGNRRIPERGLLPTTRFTAARSRPRVEATNSPSSYFGRLSTLICPYRRFHIRYFNPQIINKSPPTTTPESGPAQILKTLPYPLLSLLFHSIPLLSLVTPLFPLSSSPRAKNTTRPFLTAGLPNFKFFLPLLA
jgi:hypothetical protein